MIFCQIVATVVATKHPTITTVERMVKRRQADAIYIDYLQNIYGKTLAAAYSARASEFTGVSAPLNMEGGARRRPERLETGRLHDAIDRFSPR